MDARSWAVRHINNVLLPHGLIPAKGPLSKFPYSFDLSALALRPLLFKASARLSFPMLFQILARLRYTQESFNSKSDHGQLKKNPHFT